MNVLGIETATAVCAAALVVDREVRSERSLFEKNVHAEKLLTLVDGVFTDAGILPENIDAVAVSIGPGSFTGLRIGLSVAKGLCFALDKPIIAVPTLEALTLRALEDGKSVDYGIVLAAIDARRDEVYCQLSEVSASGIAPLWNARDLTISELMIELHGKNVQVTGDGSGKLLAGLLPDQRNTVKPVADHLAVCSAGSVALLGEQLAREGKFDDQSVLEPRYIKEFYFKSHH